LEDLINKTHENDCHQDESRNMFAASNWHVEALKWHVNGRVRGMNTVTSAGYGAAHGRLNAVRLPGSNYEKLVDLLLLQS
jgi:hypothetical protein